MKKQNSISSFLFNESRWNEINENEINTICQNFNYFRGEIKSLNHANILAKEILHFPLFHLIRERSSFSKFSTDIQIERLYNLCTMRYDYKNKIKIIKR